MGLRLCLLSVIVIAAVSLFRWRHAETIRPSRGPVRPPPPAVPAASPGRGHPTSGPPSSPEGEASPSPADQARIRIASFNVQVFGKAKAANPRVMFVLAKIAREFDVLVVEEIRDASEMVADLYLERINALPGPKYAMSEGPREGRSGSKEQYVVYYIPSRVEFLGADIWPDPQDAFEREPLLASFKAGDFEFTLVAIHIKPEAAYQEIAALADVANSLIQYSPAKHDLVLLGDFNADCGYFNEAYAENLLHGPRFRWVITNEMDTTVAASSCTYDRIVLSDDTFRDGYILGSAQVFRYDLKYGISNQSFIRSVSDHYPVVAEFRTAVR